jgi:uncharacterized membrane protein YuzA (DUF378 family)
MTYFHLRHKDFRSLDDKDKKLYYHKVRGYLNYIEGPVGGLFMKAIRFIALLLVVIGALNWGLVGFFQYDLVSHIFGGMDSMMARIIFALVGLAGIYSIGLLCRCSGGCSCGPKCKCCK